MIYRYIYGVCAEAFEADLLLSAGHAVSSAASGVIAHPEVANPEQSDGIPANQEAKHPDIAQLHI